VKIIAGAQLAVVTKSLEIKGDFQEEQIQNLIALERK
jgi:hypothetical protein